MAHLGRHAIVIGAGVGGLLAARALADYYDEVTVLERDDLPDANEPRKGVPQGRHAHGLLARGPHRGERWHIEFKAPCWQLPQLHLQLIEIDRFRDELGGAKFSDPPPALVVTIGRHHHERIDAPRMTTGGAGFRHRHRTPAPDPADR